MWTYINGEFASYPRQLSCVRLELLDSAGVRLANVDGILAESIDDLKVLLEHVWMLVILAVDILSYGRR